MITKVVEPKQGAGAAAIEDKDADAGSEEEEESPDLLAMFRHDFAEITLLPFLPKLH